MIKNKRTKDFFMILNKIVLPLLVANALWLSLFSMKTTNTIPPVSLHNTATIAGAAYFKIHTNDNCSVHTQTVHYPVPNPNNLPIQPSTSIKLVAFCNRDGDTIFYEQATNIKKIEIEKYAAKRLDPNSRHHITCATIGKGFISFYNKNDDEVSQYEMYEDDGDVEIKKVQEMFKDADDIDLSNLSKIWYCSSISSVITQACNDLCILQ